MRLCLTQKKLQAFDPWKLFQSLNILASSEKWPFCHSFRASLSSAFRTHLFHSPSLQKTKGLLLKGHCKIGVQLPTAKSIWAIRLQGTESPSHCTLIAFTFGGRVPSSSMGYSVDFRCLFIWVQDSRRLWAGYQVTQSCLCCITGLSPFSLITANQWGNTCPGTSWQGYYNPSL